MQSGYRGAYFPSGTPVASDHGSALGHRDSWIRIPSRSRSSELRPAQCRMGCGHHAFSLSEADLRSPGGSLLTVPWPRPLLPHMLLSPSVFSGPAPSPAWLYIFFITQLSHQPLQEAFPEPTPRK